MGLESSVSVFPAVGRMAEQRLADLDLVARLTEKMLHWAEEGDWELLVEAQSQRDIALRACFLAPVSNLDSGRVRAKIRELIFQNEILVKKVSEAKQRLSKAMHKTRQEIKAADRYLSVSG